MISKKQKSRWSKSVLSCQREEEMCKYAIIVGREADKSKISKWCLVHIFFTDYGGKIKHNILFSASSSSAYRRYLQCKHSRDSLLGLCLGIVNSAAFAHVAKYCMSSLTFEQSLWDLYTDEELYTDSDEDKNLKLLKDVLHRYRIIYIQHRERLVDSITVYIPNGVAKDSISLQVYRAPLCLFYIRRAKWPKYLPMCSFLMIRCYCKASHEHVKTVLTGRQWGLGGWPRIITRLLLAKKISIESGVNL